MKIYIEAIEDITGKKEDYKGDFIQEEVTDGDKKAKDKCKAREKQGRKYKYRKHFCNHEVRLENNKPCTTESLE